GNLSGCALRAIDVGRQANAVRHRHHHLAVDNRDRLELLLCFPSPLLLGGTQTSLLCPAGVRREYENKDDEYCFLHAAHHSADQDTRSFINGKKIARRFLRAISSLG